MKLLNDASLYGSVELLGTLCDDVTLPRSADILIEIGNGYFGKEDWRRAVECYNNALTKMKSLSSNNNQNTNESNESNSQTDSEKEIQLKYKIAECYFRLKAYRHAQQTFVSIPASYRTLSIHFKMGQICQIYNAPKNAIAYFREVVRHLPFAVEAIHSLIELGVSPTEIKHLIVTDSNNNSKSDVSQSQKSVKDLLSAPLETTKQTICDIVDAYYDYWKQNFELAIEKYLQLEKRFPRNVYILKQLALCHFKNHQQEKAQSVFEKIRTIDRCYVDNMDVYACISKIQGNIVELNRLAHDMLTSYPNRAETWTTIALYYELKGKKEQAFVHLERALACNPRHALAYELKGWLLIATGQLEAAISPFKTAIQLTKDLSAYKGLCEALIHTGKFKEALAAASEANALRPEHPHRLALLGYCYVADSTQRDKAQQILQKALQLDPNCLDAVIGLAQLFKLQNKTADSIKLLENYLEKFNTDYMHVALAEVLMASGKYNDALVHYNAALELNPFNSVALTGVANCEKLLKEGSREESRNGDIVGDDNEIDDADDGDEVSEEVIDPRLE